MWDIDNTHVYIGEQVIFNLFYNFHSIKRSHAGPASYWHFLTVLWQYRYKFVLDTSNRLTTHA